MLCASGREISREFGLSSSVGGGKDRTGICSSAKKKPDSSNVMYLTCPGHYGCCEAVRFEVWRLRSLLLLIVCKVLSLADAGVECICGSFREQFERSLRLVCLNITRSAARAHML